MNAASGPASSALKRAFVSAMDGVATTANTRQSAAKGFAQPAATRSISQTRSVRFITPRPLQNLRETEQLADHFRGFGRLVAYRVFRCQDTHRRTSVGLIQFASDAKLDELDSLPIQKIPALDDMEVRILPTEYQSFTRSLNRRPSLSTRTHANASEASEGVAPENTPVA
ncbi:hypothetical protein THASP1DRAFT_28647 [Thamnocephalis sphaerospora]|uniref:RRM domain-containing protein n=1 Tax=Thamnocephalis sphaerospora TaxID=78915 RepID=A0A4P9XUE3_9FUNG|nr:hypothetical protein THASP1DRAFT_28647 [Thamnocephalis sphaerospora]|eukprot:RKP09572.1 hypothetical protein THASP1DRAFT_28647 [Thamnocephalis sphaerospora]